MEKKRLASAFLTASKDPRYKDTFGSLVWSHSVFACSVISAKWNLYHLELAFHRVLVLAMENILRMVDCRVTLPYWDIGRDYLMVSPVTLIATLKYICLNPSVEDRPCLLQTSLFVFNTNYSVFKALISLL